VLGVEGSSRGCWGGGVVVAVEGEVVIAVALVALVGTGDGYEEDNNANKASELSNSYHDSP